MSVVWTTIAVIALLLPGVFFFIGLATYERLSREIIRSGVVSEIALATMVAITLHLVCLSVLSAFGFRLTGYVLPLVEPNISTAELVERFGHRLVAVVLYFMATAAVASVSELSLLSGSSMAGSGFWPSTNGFMTSSIAAEREES
jgi:D-alanyl-lipoteichoic acid acyltransferase DltB (MBOAT superfamily)